MAESPVIRRVVYSLMYEGIAIVCSTTILFLLGNDLLRSLPLAALSSGIAIVWNIMWNTFFEYVEKKRGWKGRSFRVRVAHALGFEGGLALVCVPLLSIWLNLPLVEAFVTQIGLLIFFLIYTYVFNLSFDKVFGLPESAR